MLTRTLLWSPQNIPFARVQKRRRGIIKSHPALLGSLASKVLDWVSITLSIMSFILFMIFTIQIIEFDKNFAEDFPTFMTLISQLSASMRLYVRLSAFNVIVIFFRSRSA